MLGEPTGGAPRVPAQAAGQCLMSDVVGWFWDDGFREPFWALRVLVVWGIAVG